MTLTPLAAPPWGLVITAGVPIGLPADGDLASPWALVLALALLLSLAGQALLTGWFALQVRRLGQQRSRWPEEPAGGWPAAEVVLCLRGADPSLGGALAALAHQR